MLALIEIPALGVVFCFCLYCYLRRTVLALIQIPALGVGFCFDLYCYLRRTVLALTQIPVAVSWSVLPLQPMPFKADLMLCILSYAITESKLDLLAVLLEPKAHS